MIKRVFVVSLIALLILSTFALAIGSSSGNARVRDTPVAVTANATAMATCEDKDSVEGRIKCRFENRETAQREAYSNIEEACRSSENSKRDACIKLYNRSAACYDESNPVAKKRCFLKESGVNINAGGTFRAAPDETKRNYVVLLLYELQERIEIMQESGQITVDQATSLVAKIVEIKKMIIAGEKRADIVVKMQEFKQEYRLTVSGVAA